MLNHLLLSLILTGLFYFYNQRTGNVLDNTQYAMAFAGIALGLAIVYRYMLPGTAMPSVTQFLGLEGPSNGPNGEQEVPCYASPYKVIKTQYGDRALLGGYNENLGTYESGAAGKYDPPTLLNVNRACVNVEYQTAPVQ